MGAHSYVWGVCNIVFSVCSKQFPGTLWLFLVIGDVIPGGHQEYFGLMFDSTKQQIINFCHIDDWLSALPQRPKVLACLVVLKALPKVLACLVVLKSHNWNIYFALFFACEHMHDIVLAFSFSFIDLPVTFIILTQLSDNPSLMIKCNSLLHWYLSLLRLKKGPGPNQCTPRMLPNLQNCSRR